MLTIILDEEIVPSIIYHKVTWKWKWLPSKAVQCISHKIPSDIHITIKLKLAQEDQENQIQHPSDYNISTTRVNKTVTSKSNSQVRRGENDFSSNMYPANNTSKKNVQVKLKVVEPDVIHRQRNKPPCWYLNFCYAGSLSSDFLLDSAMKNSNAYTESANRQRKHLQLCELFFSPKQLTKANW